MLLPDFSEYFCGEAGRHLESLLRLALAEDGPDLTSDGVFSPDDRLQALIIAKERTHVSGLSVVPLVMQLCAESGSSFEKKFSGERFASEGEVVEPGHVVAKVSGTARDILRRKGSF